MCSVAGGMASQLVDREIPSQLIPFCGEFPLLDMIEARRFREAICSTMWIEDLPPKFLYAAAEGSRMARLERGFLHYLSRNGLKSGDFEKLEDAEKSEWLRWWMEDGSVSADDLAVKKYGMKPPRPRNPSATRRCRLLKSGKSMTILSPGGLIGTICVSSSGGLAGRKSC